MVTCFIIRIRPVAWKKNFFPQTQAMTSNAKLTLSNESVSYEMMDKYSFELKTLFKRLQNAGNTSFKWPLS
jgi:hypothetical protein